LHFELRDLLTEHPYNPLLFTAFKSVQDHLKPNIRRIKIYALSKDGVPISGYTSSRKVRNSNGKYSITDGVWTISSSFCSKEGGIGFAVDAVDYMDDSYNQCGIYESALLVNDDTVFQQNMRALDFETQRYINAHVDLYEYWQYGRKLQKQFKTPFNKLPIYSDNKNGILHFVPDSSYRIHYYCKDAKGNISTISFVLNITAGNVRAEYDGIDNYSANFWYPDSSYQYSNEFCAVSISKDVLLAPIKKNIQFNNRSVTVGEEGVVLNQKYTLCWNVDSTEFVSQTLIALRTANGKLKPLESFYDGAELYASTNRFGTFLLAVDSLPPAIYPKGFYDSAQVSVSANLRWRVSDNFSGIGAYNLYVDKNWIPIEYDYKNNDLILKLPLQEGWHSFLLYVEDKLGNTKMCSTHLHVLPE
jgi:hypothetical protein